MPTPQYGPHSWLSAREDGNEKRSAIRLPLSVFPFAVCNDAFATFATDALSSVTQTISEIPNQCLGSPSGDDWRGP